MFYLGFLFFMKHLECFISLSLCILYILWYAVCELCGMLMYLFFPQRCRIYNDKTQEKTTTPPLSLCFYSPQCVRWLKENDVWTHRHSLKHTHRHRYRHLCHHHHHLRYSLHYHASSHTIRKGEVFSNKTNWIACYEMMKSMIVHIH